MKKRCIRIPVYFSPEEYKCLNKISEATGLSRNVILRESLKRNKLLAAPPIDYSKFIRELRMVGNNLNQLVLIARNAGFINVSELEKVLSDIRTLEKDIREKFTFEFEERSYGDC